MSTVGLGIAVWLSQAEKLPGSEDGYCRYKCAGSEWLRQCGCER